MRGLDHLVYATPDLDGSVEELAARLGVRPTPGGRHPHWGTRNALLALSDSAYLEVIGPDPGAPAPTGGRPFGIDALGGGRLVTWAAGKANLEHFAARARSAGVDLGGIESRSRKLPEGGVLAWRATDLGAPRLSGVIPFLIDWSGSPHPAGTAASGCTLASLRAEHPEPARVRAALEALALDLTVERGDLPKLIAVLGTPRGLIEL